MGRWRVGGGGDGGDVVYAVTRREVGREEERGGEAWVNVWVKSRESRLNTRRLSSR